MDSLDPLNTIDPTTPHTSAISSNRYLVKKAEEKVITGNILRVVSAQDLEPGFEGGWWACVGTDMTSTEEWIQGQRSALVHIKGLKLTWKDGKGRATKDEQAAVLARLVFVGTETLGKLGGSEIGEFQGKRIWGDVVEPSSEEPDIQGLFQALSATFPYDQYVLAYYVYAQFKRFPSITEPRIQSIQDPELIEKIEQLNLAKYRTGEPKPVSSSESPVASDPVASAEVPQESP